MVGTGRRAPVTFERVIDTAMRLADEGGLDALTMRSLAAALKVEPMSLYHHVANKDEILDAMVERVFTAMPRPTGKSWKKAMRERAHATRAALLEHRWALGVFESRRTPGMAALRHQDAAIRCLREAGFSMKLIGHALPLLEAFVYGFVVQERNLPVARPKAIQDRASGILAQFDPSSLPHLCDFVAKHVMKPGYDFAGEFDFGVGLLLDGLEARLPRRRIAGRASRSTQR